jgi:DNA-binding LacI/PurR family transcriptional regulator
MRKRSPADPTATRPVGFSASAGRSSAPRSGPPERLTLRSLSLSLNLSTSAVSIVLNARAGSERIPAVTRERILAAGATVPVVRLMSNWDGRHASSASLVALDLGASADAAIRHVVGLGHRRLALLSAAMPFGYSPSVAHVAAHQNSKSRWLRAPATIYSSPHVPWRQSGDSAVADWLPDASPRGPVGSSRSQSSPQFIVSHGQAQSLCWRRRDVTRRNR